MKELIDLQSAHVTQLTGKDGKGPWKVRKNITSEDLYELPEHLTEEDIFTIMEFARGFEIRALNIGIQFGKGINMENLKLAREENVRLADALDREMNKNDTEA